MRAAILICLLLVCSETAIAADKAAPAKNASEKSGDKGAGEKGAAAAEVDPNLGLKRYGAICQAEVHYYWQLLSSQEHAAAEGDNKAEGIHSAVLAYYTTLNEQAKVEEDAKARLTSRLTSAQAEAFSTCKDEHENELGCVERRLGKFARGYGELDYKSRKIVMSSVMKDCIASRGVCLSAEVSPVKCWVDTPPEAEIAFVNPNETLVETVQTGVAPSPDTKALVPETSAVAPTIAKAPRAKPRVAAKGAAGALKPGAQPGGGPDEGNFRSLPPGEAPDNPLSKPFSF